VCQYERHCLSGGDFEICDCLQIFTADRRRRVQDHHVRPGDRAQRAIVHARDPRDRAAVVEAEHQLHAHAHASALAAHYADDIGVTPAWGHEVDEKNDAVGRLDAGLEDQRVAAIAPRYSRARVLIDRFD
jgi:hypothetical protein